LPVRGREDELARVQQRLTEVSSGVGTVIVVEGRAGLVKATILDASASIAGQMSLRVGRGMAEPGRSTVELEPL
jgi:predicted ATPase